jgi:cytidylate kinase
VEGTIPVIAIDGPAASGKGTIAYNVAHALGFHYLDSGALYRLVALRAIEQRMSPHDTEALAQLAAGVDVAFREGRAIVDGRDVADALRGEQVSAVASRIAVHPASAASVRLPDSSPRGATWGPSSSPTPGSSCS